MQLIQCGGQAWTELTKAITQRQLSAGVRIIQGSSRQLSREIQTLLNNIDASSVQYLLSSSDTCFNLPCYEALLNTGPASVEPLDAFHVMDYSGLSARETREVYTSQYAIYELQRKLERGRTTFHCVILEYLTAPTQDDILFMQQIFLSAFARRIPVLIFIHGEENDLLEDDQHWSARERELLAYLYMAGGRIRDVEWRRLTAFLPPLSNLRTDDLVSMRSVGATAWITYRSRAVANSAPKIFRMLSQSEQQDYARELVKVLPSGILYPLLSIARTADDLASLLACYTSLSIKAALIQPHDVLAYFRMFRRFLKKTSDPTLLEAATVNYISALLCCYRRAPARVHRLLQENEAYLTNRAVKARFLFALGQVLMQSRDQSSLQYATDCFQKSRSYLLTIETIDQYERASRLASIYNGEALIALKQERYETALRLEEMALAELQKVAEAGLESINIQQILFMTHIGDVYGRKLGNREMALLFYKKAYALARTSSSFVAKTYIAPRLADLLIQSKSAAEATPVLEDLWQSLRLQQKMNTQSSRTLTLKTGLVLAQMYMQRDMQRKAAFYYWNLLRQSEWLKPATVQGIVANLKHCRPGMHSRLWRYATRTITLQELAMRDVAGIEVCFDNVSDGNTSSPVMAESEDALASTHAEERK